MGMLIQCDVEVPHDDPAMIDRVMRASSRDVRYLMAEFMPNDEGALSSIRAHPETMPTFAVDARRTVRLVFCFKNHPPIDLFDAMVAAGYGVRCTYDDTDYHYGDTWRYEDGVKTHVGHFDANGEDVKAMAALEHEVAAAFLAERWAELGRDFEPFRRRWLVDAAARGVEYVDYLLDAPMDGHPPFSCPKEPEPAE
jgi:hypothetical protein